MKFPGPPKRWNDWLAVLLLVGVPLLWLYGNLSDMVVGATISGWTLVVQYYFRKKEDNAAEQPPVPHG